MLRTDPAPTHGDAPMHGLTALYDEPAGTTAIFAVNRAPAHLELTVDLRAMPATSAIEHLCIAAAEPDAVNTAAHPNPVSPQRLPCPTTDRAILTAQLPATSWNLIRLATQSPE